MKISYSILMTLLSGILLTLAFPPLPLYLFAFIGFVPLLFVFSHKEVKFRFALIYIAFFIYHFGSNWWISSWQDNTDPYLFYSGIALAIAHPVFFMIPFVVLFYLEKKIGYNKALWFFPFIWTSFEWLHSLGEFSYPWLTIGNTQILNLYWIQFIDVTGIWGASLLIMIINVASYHIIMHIRNNIEKSNWQIIKSSFSIKFNSIVIILLIVFPLLYSIDRNYQYAHDELAENNEKITISLIQPNINPWEKWDQSVIEQVRLHKHIQDSISNKIEDIDLTIWSETSIPYLSLEFNAFGNYTLLQRWINQHNISILTGFSEFYFYKEGEAMQQPIKQIELDTPRYYITYNAALLLNPAPYSDNNPQIYRKSKLTPFAERFPYADQLSFAQDWIQWGVGISAWGRGQGAKSMEITKGDDTTRIGSIICIESIYPKFCTGFARDGAEVLSVITNDAWYNYTVGPRQHYIIAAARAIENRRYIARCANSGVSGFISPTGRSILEAPPYKKTALVMAVPKMNILTFYVKYGDWLPVISLITVFLGILLAFINKTQNNNEF